MIVWTIGDIIGCVFLAVLLFLFFIYLIIIIIKSLIDRNFKKNCFECKYYYLEDVAGAGDCCWYNCKIYKEYHKDRHKMNDRYKYRKCKDFDKVEGDK